MSTIHRALVEVFSTEQGAAVKKMQRRVPILAISLNDTALGISSPLPRLDGCSDASFARIGRLGDDENLYFRMPSAQDIDEHRQCACQMLRIRTVGIVVQDKEAAVVDACDGFGDLRLSLAIAGESEIDTGEL